MRNKPYGDLPDHRGEQAVPGDLTRLTARIGLHATGQALAMGPSWTRQPCSPALRGFRRTPAVPRQAEGLILPDLD
ncbi:hypothetical protein [Streptosporangium carneum]|uniref:Uncharacterized protein n=1 Tax=Streptosporangium carneum TaxID=47481 RepID=A0A9W6MH36_9ACTN|nr:hypothetical protein [Streptosporangium carneum]GLK13603.1 hypothetical protein GCM10017600_70140 [Streptosporangium carneum]